MSEHTALIVDDEPAIRELLEITLGRMGINTHAAEDLGGAKTLLKDDHFDICLTDMRLPDGNGIDLVSYIQRDFPDIPVAVITAHGNMESAIAALKAGAFDFVSKPVDLQILRELVKTALRLGEGTSKSERGGAQLLGESGAMVDLRQKIAKVARSQAPVYIHGESGTGKELVARLIHTQSARDEFPFVPVNCGAIPSELMESEFFGHKKGSFTGAVVDKQGLFQASEGGTLFLDEVAELPLHMQVKLLRAIQEKAIRPVGAPIEVPVNVRILSASHKDLTREVQRDRFRQDLYYRINVIELDVPSLRERVVDIEILAQDILRKLTSEYPGTAPYLSPRSLESLSAYAFPGNVRELENVLERALAMCEGDSIEPEDLGLRVEESVQEPAGNSDPVAETLDEQLESQERDALTQALEQTRWNKTAAAELLGMSYRQLRYRLKKLGID